MTKMTRVTGLAQSAIQFHTTIKHGSGQRDVGVEVSKEMILELANVMTTYPCCAGESTAHAVWHVTMHEPVCRETVNPEEGGFVVEDLGDDAVARLHDAKRHAREAMLVAQGFEEPTDDQRKANLDAAVELTMALHGAASPADKEEA